MFMVKRNKRKIKRYVKFHKVLLVNYTLGMEMVMLVPKLLYKQVAEGTLLYINFPDLKTGFSLPNGN